MPSGDVRADKLGTAPQVTSAAIDSAGIEASELTINGVEIRATR